MPRFALIGAKEGKKRELLKVVKSNSVSPLPGSTKQRSYRF
jgi:hypothetical protein